MFIFTYLTLAALNFYLAVIHKSNGWKIASSILCGYCLGVIAGKYIW